MILWICQRHHSLHRLQEDAATDAVVYLQSNPHSHLEFKPCTQSMLSLKEKVLSVEAKCPQLCLCYTLNISFLLLQQMHLDLHTIWHEKVRKNSLVKINTPIFLLTDRQLQLTFDLNRIM